jgi:hypothetical protein
MVRHQDILRAGEIGSPYAFRHALYRQALYDGIPPARRRRMHGRVGESLAAARSPGSVEGAAELAEHFARAGDHAQAASYHAQAAEAARARFADREVAAHLSAALAHVRRSPRTAERDGYELVLLPQHAAAVLAANGFGDAQVGGAYRRLQKLAGRLEMPLAHFAASAGLLLYHLMRAELDAAASLAGELTAAAPGLPLAECAAAARASTGAILFSRGDLKGARRLLDGLHGAFPRREPGSPLDAATWYLGILSMVDAELGDSAAARATCADLLAGADGGGPIDVASGHMLVAIVEAQLRNAPLVLEHAETASRIAAEYDAPRLVTGAAQLRAWAMAATGDAAGASTALTAGEAAWRAEGQRLGRPFFAVLRAETALFAGDRAGAQAAIAAGLEHAEATGEHRQDSDLHRLRAECLRRAGRIAAAAVALDLALDIAAAQGARVAELRAAIDSFRIHRATSRSAGAARRLAGVAAAFDDPASVPELSAALTLLRSHARVPNTAGIPARIEQ